MENQKYIDKTMRTVQIYWISKLCEKYKSKIETFMISCDIFDRYLSKKIIKKEKLQLVTIVAFFIACKFEEINEISLYEIKLTCGNKYTIKQIIKRELKILKAIDFKIYIPKLMYMLCEWEIKHKQKLNYYFAARCFSYYETLRIPLKIIVKATANKLNDKKTISCYDRLKTENQWTVFNKIQ